LLLKSLYENNLIPHGRLQYFFNCNGRLNFYNKMELKLITNIELMYGKITTIKHNEVINISTTQ